MGREREREREREVREYEQMDKECNARIIDRHTDRYIKQQTHIGR